MNTQEETTTQVWKETVSGLTVKERRMLALQPGLDQAAIPVLAGDPADIVRYGVAVNPATPGGVLVHLAEDSEWEVRAAVAMNANTPLDTLLTLIHDRDDLVSETANQMVEMRSAS